MNILYETGPACEDIDTITNIYVLGKTYPSSSVQLTCIDWASEILDGVIPGRVEELEQFSRALSHAWRSTSPADHKYRKVFVRVLKGCMDLAFENPSFMKVIQQLPGLERQLLQSLAVFRGQRQTVCLGCRNVIQSVRQLEVCPSCRVSTQMIEVKSFC